MAEQDVTDEIIEAEPREELDPEVAQRRAEALAHVRQYGDPVLRARAREITEFDDDLLAEIAQMGALMNDALGIGLAATQVGMLRRLLVYRVEPDSPVN